MTSVAQPEPFGQFTADSFLETSALTRGLLRPPLIPDGWLTPAIPRILWQKSLKLQAKSKVTAFRYGQILNNPTKVQSQVKFSGDGYGWPGDVVRRASKE